MKFLNRFRGINDRFPVIRLFFNYFRVELLVATALHSRRTQCQKSSNLRKYWKSPFQGLPMWVFKTYPEAVGLCLRWELSINDVLIVNLKILYISNHTFFPTLQISIEAREFVGLSTVKQHRLVTNSLKTEISEMHGIRIHTTPSPADDHWLE